MDSGDEKQEGEEEDDPDLRQGERVMEVNLTDDKVEDVMRRIPKDEDAYVTMHGKVLKRSEKLKSCEVTDGCTIQVMSRMRGGGKHKDKKSKVEKKQPQAQRHRSRSSWRK